MELIILKENLQKALNIVSRSISIRPQLPILSHILLQAKNNQLTLSATNLELGIVYSTHANISKEGEIAIPGKLLIEFITSIFADKIKLTADNKKLIVQAKNTKASFTTMDAADFPPFPKISNLKKSIPEDLLEASVPRAVFAASVDESRPVLTGVKVTIADQKLTLAATDGYRMSLEQMDLTGKPDQMNTILPAQSLSEVIRIAQETDAKEVSLSLIENKNQVVFMLPSTQIYSRLIDGEFPNIEKIIPVSFKTKVVVDKEVFLRAVKTASLFARGAANIVKIKIEKDGLRLSANTPQVGEDEDFIEAQVQGEELEVAFNYRFLLDLLNHFPDKEVSFETTGSISPGVFRPVRAKIQFLHVVMPVRVQT